MRGDRNWLDLWELIDELPVGSKYKSARLRDPEFAAALAAMPESDEADDLPLDGWNAYLDRLANIEDLLHQLIYTTAHVDPSAAPTTLRPVLPHLKLRRERAEQARAVKRSLIVDQLIPGGDGA